MSTRETRSSSSKSAGKKKSPNPSSDAETITLESINPTFLTDILRTFPATIEKLVSRIEDLTSHVGELEEKLNRLQTTVNPSTTPDVCPTCKGTATASTNFPKAVEHNNDSTDDMECSKLTLEVANILMKEKMEQTLKDECRAIKSNILLEWENNVKSRSKFFRNFVKNDRKSQLYDDWAAKSPDYIPFKFRPKRIPGEKEHHRTARIEEAKRKYSRERELLKEYAQSHLENVRKIDKGTAELFRRKVDNDQQYSVLWEQWAKESRKEESRAQLLWTRNERFLKKKKHEDEQQGNGVLADTTWGEKLRSYSKKKQNFAPDTAANQFLYAHCYPTQLPWRL